MVLLPLHKIKAVSSTDEGLFGGAGAPVQRHQPTVERMEVHYRKRDIPLNEARLRMATLPTVERMQVLFVQSHHFARQMTKMCAALSA